MRASGLPPLKPSYLDDAEAGVLPPASLSSAYMWRADEAPSADACALLGAACGREGSRAFEGLRLCLDPSAFDGDARYTEEEVRARTLPPATSPHAVRWEP